MPSPQAEKWGGTRPPVGGTRPPPRPPPIDARDVGERAFR